MIGKSDAQLVFVFLLAHADLEGFVDKKQELVAALTGMTVERVQVALDYLEAPDPDSRTEAMDGRRLERIHAHRNWGWRVVNFLQYRNLRNEEERREQNRNAQRARRQKVTVPAGSVSRGQPPVTDLADTMLTVADGVPRSAHTEAETEADRCTASAGAAAAPATAGMPAEDALDDRAAFAEAEGGELPLEVAKAASGALLESGAAVRGEAVLIFPTNKRGEGWPLTSGQAEEWRALFPAVDVMQEMRTALAWCTANKERRKTAGGMVRFLVRWLAKAQDNAGRRPPQSVRARTDAAYADQVRVIGGNDGQ